MPPHPSSDERNSQHLRRRRNLYENHKQFTRSAFYWGAIPRAIAVSGWQLQLTGHKFHFYSSRRVRSGSTIIALVRLVFSIALSRLSITCVLGTACCLLAIGCGLTLAIPAPATSITLAAATTTLNPNQRISIEVQTKGVARSSLSLHLQCTSSQCGTL